MDWFFTRPVGWALATANGAWVVLSVLMAVDGYPWFWAQALINLAATIAVLHALRRYA